MSLELYHSSHTELQLLCFLSLRFWSVGVGMIDAFFDFWLPTFVDGVRALIRGKQIAREMHQEDLQTHLEKSGFSIKKTSIGDEHDDQRMKQIF